MAEEFNALMVNCTWDLVPPHAKQNLVRSKWVYQVKHHSDGIVERRKARLVAQRFHQQARLDYHETFVELKIPQVHGAIVASDNKYGSCPQRTRFQPPNQYITLYLGQNLLKLIFSK